MALYSTPTQITEVLLSDGWHPVMASSFTLSGAVDDTQTEFNFTAYIAASGALVKIGGLMPEISAVKSDPRQVGQLERRYVQPDGHLQVRLASGWVDIPQVAY